MDSLASLADLYARPLVAQLTDPEFQTLLDSASSEVRDAAGCSISFATSTVTLVVHDPWEFDLPAGPVSSVSSVLVAGVPVTGWRKLGDTLLFSTSTWADLPAEVTVTYAHGYPVVPEDIIDLVCALVNMAAGDTDDGYGNGTRLASYRLGELAESYVHPAGTDSPSPISLPDSVRARLRARFGTSVALVKMR